MLAKLSPCATSVFILFTLILGYSPTSLAEGYCIENWACSDVTTSAETRTFWLENNKAYPITVTLIVSANNLRSHKASKREYTETRVLQGFERKSVLELYPINQNRRSHYSYKFRWSPGDMNAVHDINYPYRYPFAPNAKHTMVQGFNGRYSHQGASRFAVDFAMPVGTAVHAARNGIVIDLIESNTRGGASRRYAKYANFITVLHDDGTTGEYYHLQYKGALVEVGDKVSAGQHIGYSGNTGFSSLPHLHFAVYRALENGGYESQEFKFSG